MNRAERRRVAKKNKKDQKKIASGTNSISQLANYTYINLVENGHIDKAKLDLVEKSQGLKEISGSEIALRLFSAIDDSLANQPQAIRDDVCEIIWKRFMNIMNEKK